MVRKIYITKAQKDTISSYMVDGVSFEEAVSKACNIPLKALQDEPFQLEYDPTILKTEKPEPF